MPLSFSFTLLTCHILYALQQDMAVVCHTGVTLDISVDINITPPVQRADILPYTISAFDSRLSKQQSSLTVQPTRLSFDPPLL